ncbi:MAG: choice-of-anchor D domain-containing protein, partial [Deltaproteobacteria bacterium]
KETSDGGYVALARGEGFIEVIKLKSDGNLDWQQRIVTGSETEAYDVYERTERNDVPLGIIEDQDELREGMTAVSDMLFFVSEASGALRPVPLLEFGGACVGETAVLPFRFDNASNARITIMNISSPADPFSVPGCDQADPSCCSVLRTLNPGEFCFIPVQFSPPAPGLFTSTLDISYRIRGCEFDCDFIFSENLVGAGGRALMNVNPTTLDFGTLCTGSSLEKTVTVRNNGDCPGPIGTIGSPAAPFSIVGGTCSNNQTLNPGGSCSVVVRFTPTSVGSFNSRFALSSVDVTLTGTGSQQNITLSPSNVDFGNVCAGNVSEQTVTVRNDGNCPATLGPVGPPAEPFSITGGTCSNNQTLNPGQSCTFVVRFAPTSAGSFNSSLAVSSVNVTLTGLSGQQQITVSPTRVSFASLGKGKRSEKTITVTNTAACPTGLALRTISVPESSFTVVGGTCTEGKILGMGESCSIIVRFSPTRAGSFISTLDISSDDPDTPTVVVNLEGGSGPDLVGELTSLDKKCRNTGRGVQCTIKAVINIKNIGSNDAPPCCVKFFLSNAEGFHQGDPLLMQTDTNGVRAGKGRTTRFNLTLPFGETGSNRFLTWFVNATHCFIEANEANNMKSIRIP